MFARRREIEVMKLVGATNWFIRLPFMLEGLLQGFIGGVLASGGDAGVQPELDERREVVPVRVRLRRVRRHGRLPDLDRRSRDRLGMLVGAIGSGTAASRFLDV